MTSLIGTIIPAKPDMPRLTLASVLAVAPFQEAKASTSLEIKKGPEGIALVFADDRSERVLGGTNQEPIYQILHRAEHST